MDDISENITLRERIKLKIDSIARISEDLPSIIIIVNLRTKRVEFMSERGLKILKTTLQDLKDMGSSYFEAFFNTDDSRNYMPRFFSMLEENHPENVFSYFQQVKARDEQEWGWYVTSTKVLMCDDDGNPYLIISAAHPAEELKGITYKIERLLDENRMMHEQFAKYAQLTKREKEIIVLLVAGNSSATIAEKLFISFSTVEQHRKNIKNKLSLKTLPQLVRFAQAFNMG